MKANWIRIDDVAYNAHEIERIGIDKVMSVKDEGEAVVIQFRSGRVVTLGLHKGTFEKIVGLLNLPERKME